MKSDKEASFDIFEAYLLVWLPSGEDLDWLI